MYEIRQIIQRLRLGESNRAVAKFRELACLNGRPTAAYVFTSALAAEPNAHRIRFEVVPEPGTYALMAVGMLAAG